MPNIRLNESVVESTIMQMIFLTLFEWSDWFSSEARFSYLAPFCCAVSKLNLISTMRLPSFDMVIVWANSYTFVSVVKSKTENDGISQMKKQRLCWNCAVIYFTISIILCKLNKIALNIKSYLWHKKET